MSFSLRTWLVGGVLGLLLAGVASAAESFAGGLTAAQRQAAGLDTLTTAELTQLDQLVANDAAQSGALRNGTFALPFSGRHAAAEQHAAGLDRLTAAQREQLDELVAATLADRPQPKPRPRLKDNEVVSLARRLEVHGGMSFTYGWAGGGRNFREVGAWVSYYDPVSGIELGIGMSRFSGDLPFGYYDGYYPYGDMVSLGAAKTFGADTRATIAERGGLFAPEATDRAFAGRGGFGGRGGGRRF